MRAHVVENLLLSLSHADPIGVSGSSPRFGVHLLHDLRHVRHGCFGGADDVGHAVVQRSQVRLRDNTCDLDQFVAVEVQSCHLAVEPDQPVGGLFVTGPA